MIAACGQLEAKPIDNASAVWPALHRIAEEAANAQADILVLPETAYPAYWLASAERYRRDDIERSQAVLDRYAELAAERRFWLVAGYIEEDGDALYNAAAVFNRDGQRIGVARKQFMWDCDRRWFTPGEESVVVETEFGPMGLLICADARMPEIPATLANLGATFVAMPTAWVNASKTPGAHYNIQPECLIRARAKEFGLPFICTSKSGLEKPGLEYVGQSQIVDADGEVAAVAPLGGDAITFAQLTPRLPNPPAIDINRLNRLLSKSPPIVSADRDQKYTLNLRQPADAVAADMRRRDVHVAECSSEAFSSFAPSRCCALDGVQAIVASGRIADDPFFARTRAAENCLFVIIAGPERTQYVIDPTGAIIWGEDAQDDAIELDIGLANVKAFTPTTDIWSQRRVYSYQLETKE